MPRFPFSPHDDLWRFDTARFSVRLYASEEDMHPREALTRRADIAYALEGGSHWFCAWVVVWQLDEEGEIVETGVPLGLERRFDAGEPAFQVRRCRVGRLARPPVVIGQGEQRASGRLLG